MIERLHHLYILDGSPSVYADLAREWERRGERWCGGVKYEPPMTLEELRDWAEVTFFEDGLRATIETSAFQNVPTVYLHKIDAPPRTPSVAHVWLSAEGRPRFRFFGVVVERSNYVDFCAAVLPLLRNPFSPLNAAWFCTHTAYLVDRLTKCAPYMIPSGSCTDSC